MQTSIAVDPRTTSELPDEADQSELDRVKALLNALMARFGACSCTLYVDDPTTGDLRLVLSPGVKYPEPLLGVALPRSEVAALPSQPPSVDYILNSEAKQPPQPRPRLAQKIAEETGKVMFHSLIEREGIKAFVRAYAVKQNSSHPVVAVLFLNFDAVLTAFIDTRSNGLIDTVKNAVKECLADIVDTFRNSTGHLELINSQFSLDARQLSAILAPLEQLVEVDGHDSDNKLAYALRSILQATLAAFNITRDNGFASVHLLASDKRHLFLAAETTEGVCSPIADLRKGQGIVSWVFARQQSILIPDLCNSAFSEAVYQKTKQSSASEIAAPMLVGTECIGVINVESARAHAFTPADVQLLSHAAHQAAIACCLYKDSVWSSKLAELFDVTTSHITGTTEGTTVLDTLARKMAEWLNWDGCVLFYYKDTEHEWFESGASSEIFRQDDHPRIDGWSDFIRKEKSPLFLSDIDSGGTPHVRLEWNEKSSLWCDCSSKVPSSLSKVNNAVTQLKVTSQLGLPLKFRNRVTGVVWLKSYQKKSEVTIDIVLASGLATQCSMVTESVRRQRRYEVFAEMRIERQRAFFPTGVIKTKCVEGYVISDPFEHQIGGDFFRIHEIDGSATGVVLGDTIGHGPMAATDMTPLYAASRIFESTLESPSYFVKQLHALALKMGLVAEVIAFTLYKRSGHMWLNASSAGTLVLSILRHKTTADKGNCDIITFPDHESAIGKQIGDNYLKEKVFPLPIEQRIELLSGDIIVAVTDGVLDAHGHAGDKLGHSGIKSILANCADKSPKEIADDIMSAAQSRADGHPHDDLTIVVLKVLPLRGSSRRKKKA